MDLLWVGVAGPALLLALFLANQFGRLATSSRAYDFGNALGAALLVAYAVSIEAWPFAVLNAV